MQASLASYGFSGSTSYNARPSGSTSTTRSPKRAQPTSEDGGAWLQPHSGRRRPRIEQHEELNLGSSDLPDEDGEARLAPTVEAIEIDEDEESDEAVSQSLTSPVKVDKGKKRAISISSADESSPAASPRKKANQHVVEDSDTEDEEMQEGFFDDEAEESDEVEVVSPPSPPRRRLVKKSNDFSLVVPTTHSPSPRPSVAKSKRKTSQVILEDSDDSLPSASGVDWTKTLRDYDEEDEKRRKRRGEHSPERETSMAPDSEAEGVPPVRCRRASPQPALSKRAKGKQRARTPTPESSESENDIVAPKRKKSAPARQRRRQREESHVSDSEVEKVASDEDEDDLELDHDTLQKERLRPQTQKPDKFAELKAARAAKKASWSSQPQAILDSSDEEEEPPTHPQVVEIASTDEEEFGEGSETEGTSPQNEDDFVVDDEDSADDDGHAELRRMRQLNEIKTAPLKTIIKDVLLGFVYDLVFPGQHYLELEVFAATRKRARRVIDEELPSLVHSAGWTGEFNKACDWYPCFADIPLDDREIGCKVCGREQRVGSWEIRLSGQPYDRDTYKPLPRKNLPDDVATAADEPFVAGRTCHERSHLYHELKHFEWSAYQQLDAAIISYSRKKDQRPARKEGKKAERAWVKRLIEFLDERDISQIVNDVHARKEVASKKWHKGK